MDDTVRIAVMGMTGAGKSTFIKTLVPDADIAIGGDMNSRKSENLGTNHTDLNTRNN